MEGLTGRKSSFGQSFRNASDLYHFLGWEMPEDIKAAAAAFPLFVPQRVARRMREQGPNGVLAREFLPRAQETDHDLTGFMDPIGDKAHHKAPQLIHRYTNRALFTPTNVCPIHCRYCFRRNELTGKDELFEAGFEQTLDYLRVHPEIQEIIFTGGDPLSLSNARIEKYLQAFSDIKNLRHVRFHTRYPVIIPERIDQGLMQVLEGAVTLFQTVTIAIHANHVDEFDEDAEDAITRLGKGNVQLLSQTVLLKGVNDSAEILSELMGKFIELRVRPYYLHHPDQVQGGMHFYLPLREGRKIYGKLRQLLPGWALPHYVIDVPGGHGKVPAFNPESTSYSGQLLSRDGRSIEIREPDFFV